MLEEAGFKRSHVYWEQEDENGEDTGVWAIGEEAISNPSWVCYIVGQKKIARELSTQDLVHNTPRHIGQPEVASGVTISPLFVTNPPQMLFHCADTNR